MHTKYALHVVQLLFFTLHEAQICRNRAHRSLSSFSVRSRMISSTFNSDWSTRNCKKNQNNDSHYFQSFFLDMCQIHLSLLRFKMTIIAGTIRIRIFKSFNTLGCNSNTFFYGSISFIIIDFDLIQEIIAWRWVVRLFKRLGRHWYIQSVNDFIIKFSHFFQLIL